MLAAILVLVLSFAGIRSILAPRTTTVVARPTASPTVDQGAEEFAQEFARAYLTFNGNDTQQRESALKPFLSSTLDPDAGVQPGSGSQSVRWTSVVGQQAAGQQTLVTVAVGTSNGLMYLNIPVARDKHGFLFVPNYPAFVGPPATNPSASLPSGEQITDASLQTVVARAVTNFLAGNQSNLLADLTPNALVSLPPRHMTVTDTQQATWITPGHSVAIQATATDSHGNSWTLTYEVGVEKLDRWYVQSVQVNPTFQGGAP
jgi:Conjugative transposon protein TcpC